MAVNVLGYWVGIHFYSMVPRFLYLTHLVPNIKTTSSQCYTLYVTLLRILIHTEEKPYDKSVHTGEEPYIYDFIVVRLINKPASQK